MEYRTQYNYPDKKTGITNSGDKYLPQYIETINEKGKLTLKPSGKKNIYEMIQASHEETKIYNILEKYAQSGDDAIINKRQSIYGNFVGVPQTPIEMQNKLMQADKAFEELDKDVREAFENDKNMFKKSIMENTLEEKMKKYLEKKTYKSQPQQQEQQQQPQTTQGVNVNE